MKSTVQLSVAGLCCCFFCFFLLCSCRPSSVHFTFHSSRLRSNHPFLTIWTASSRGCLPHISGPSQLSSDHLRPPSAICLLYSSHAPCFRIAILTPAPHADRRCTPPAACHRNIILSDLSVHSLCSASTNRPRSAQSSASSFSGSPRCALTLSKTVTAPVSTRCLSISMIGRSRSSFATPAIVAREPSPSHFPISVISLLQSSSTATSDSICTLRRSISKAASSALYELVPSSSRPTLAHPLTLSSTGVNTLSCTRM